METFAATLRRPRYEVTPLAGVEEEVPRWVPRSATVTVTASPRRGLEATLALTERLAHAGYTAVPHLAARQVTDDTEVAGILRRLDDAGVRDAFVVGGDDPSPAGVFPDSLTLLEAMTRHSHRLDRVGVAGYPEGHPQIADATLADALHHKAPLATYVVTQLCFDAEAISTWTRRLRDQRVLLPVLVGVGGPVDVRRLLRVAGRIGVGASTRFLRKNRKAALRVVRTGYRPDRLLRDLEPDLRSSSSGIAGLHVYTLNDLEATERWRRRAVCEPTATTAR